MRPLDCFAALAMTAGSWLVYFGRRLSSPLRGRSRQQRNEQQANVGAERRGQESVDKGQYRRLARDGRRQQACSAARRSCRDRRRGRPQRSDRRNPIGRETTQAVDVQPDQIGMDLLAHPHERLHEGRADLAAKQSASLQEAPIVSASAGLIVPTMRTSRAVRAKD